MTEQLWTTAVLHEGRVVLACDDCAGDTPDVVGVVTFGEAPNFNYRCGVCGAIQAGRNGR